MNYLHQIFFLSGDNVFKLVYALGFFIVLALLEIFGIGLIAPYITLVIGSELEIEQHKLASWTLTKIKDRIDLDIFLGIGLVVVFTLKTGVGYFANKQIINFVQERRLGIIYELITQYQKIDYESYKQRNSSEYVHRIQNLSYEYTDKVLAPILRTMSDSFVALAIIAFLAWYDLYTLCFLIMLLIFIIGTYDFLTKHSAKRNGILANESATNMLRYVNESMLGLKQIRIYNLHDFFIARIYDAADEFKRAAVKVQLFSVLPKFLLELCIITFVVIIVIYYKFIEQSSADTIATLGVFGVAAVRLLPIANSISASFVSVRYARNSVKLLHEELHNKIPLNAGSHKQNEFFHFSNLSADGLEFSYGSKVIIKNLSFVINRGEKIGIIGPSGAGKSTLIDVIIGLNETSAGAIYVNGRNIKLENTLADPHSVIAYIPQESFLIDSSLAENIALGRKTDEIDLKRLDSAIDDSSLREWVNSLPNGIMSIIGERGMMISGGQGQRVALARAFYHKKQILILDEATSALDANTEKEIIDRLLDQNPDLTILMISHRLSSLERCDRIIKLSDGKISEEKF